MYPPRHVYLGRRGYKTGRLYARDLNYDNFFVHELAEPRSFTYNCHGTERNIVSPYHITFIDYGMAAVNGVNEHFCELRPGTLVAGVVPSTPDHFFDLSVLAVRFLTMGRKSRIAQDLRAEINQIVEANGFLKYNGVFDSRLAYFYGRENNPEWRVIFNNDALFSREEAAFYATSEEDRTDLRAFLGEFYQSLGVILGDLAQRVPNDTYEMNRMVEILRRTSDPDPVLDDFLLENKIKLGAIMTRLKREKIENRPYSPEQFLILIERGLRQ